jgi:hypothetical protein
MADVPCDTVGDAAAAAAARARGPQPVAGAWGAEEEEEEADPWAPLDYNDANGALH